MPGWPDSRDRARGTGRHRARRGRPTKRSRPGAVTALVRLPKVSSRNRDIQVRPAAALVLAANRLIASLHLSFKLPRDGRRGLSKQDALRLIADGGPDIDLL